MTIETKYNLGQKVFFLLNNKVECYPIVKIEVEVDGGDMSVNYTLHNSLGRIKPIREELLFPTKEELLKSL